MIHILDVEDDHGVQKHITIGDTMREERDRCHMHITK